MLNDSSNCQLPPFLKHSSWRACKLKIFLLSFLNIQLLDKLGWAEQLKLPIMLVMHWELKISIWKENLTTRSKYLGTELGNCWETLNGQSNEKVVLAATMFCHFWFAFQWAWNPKTIGSQIQDKKRWNWPIAIDG